jgi:hypothetical protein
LKPIDISIGNGSNIFPVGRLQRFDLGVFYSPRPLH